MRERIDPHKVLDLVERHLADEETPIGARLATLLPYIHAGFVKPPTDANVTVSSSTPPRDYSHLTLEESRAMLARLRGDPVRDADGHHMATPDHDDEKPEHPPLVAPTPDA